MKRRKFIQMAAVVPLAPTFMLLPAQAAPLVMPVGEIGMVDNIRFVEAMVYEASRKMGKSEMTGQQWIAFCHPAAERDLRELDWKPDYRLKRRRRKA